MLQYKVADRLIVLWIKQTACVFIKVSSLYVKCYERLSMQFIFSNFFFIADDILQFNYKGKVKSAVSYALENISNSTSFLSLRTKMCLLVSNSTTLPLLLVKVSQISLLWLLFLLEEDQMCGMHANQDVMWHIVKWASIMHVPSSRGCASPNACYFSLLLSNALFCRMWWASHRSDTNRQTDRQTRAGTDINNELMRWLAVLRFLSSHLPVLTHEWHVRDCSRNSLCSHQLLYVVFTHLWFIFYFRSIV